MTYGMQAGLSGAIAIHAIYSTDETVLFFERPHVGAANSGVVPNPYLTVRPRPSHPLLNSFPLLLFLLCCTACHSSVAVHNHTPSSLLSHPPPRLPPPDVT